MRIALVILALGAIALGLVDLRTREQSARQELQRLRIGQVAIRRRLFEQQSRLSEMTSLQRLRERVAAMNAPGVPAGNDLAASRPRWEPE